MSRGTKWLRLTRVLHVPEVKHSLFSMSALCDYGHTVQLKQRNCSLKKKKRCVTRIGKRSGGMYSVKLQRTSEKALEAPEDNGGMLRAWPSRLLHADCEAIRKMTQSDTACVRDMHMPLAPNICSLFIERTMTNTCMKSRRIVEAQPGADFHTH